MPLTIAEHEARVARFLAEYEQRRVLHTLAHAHTESARTQEQAAFEEMMEAHERWLSAIAAHLDASEALLIETRGDA